MWAILKRADAKLEADELDLPIDEGDDELTIRREFAPRAPAKVAVEISDADATWKWNARTADAAGRHVGLDLPALDGAAGLEWQRDDVEKTLESFTLRRPDAIALLKPKRRPLPVRPVESTAQLMAMIAPPSPRRHRIVAPALIVVAAMFVAMFVTRLRHSSHVIIGDARTAAAPKPAMIAAPLATTGTLLTTLEGKGQRVFVDGKLAFEGGQSFTVPCGKHIVRVGSGKSREVDVPCGEELAIAP